MSLNNTTEEERFNTIFDENCAELAENLPGVDAAVLATTIKGVRSDLTLAGTMRRMGKLPDGNTCVAMSSERTIVDGEELSVVNGACVNLVIDCDHPIDYKGRYRFTTVPSPMIEISEEADVDYGTLAASVAEFASEPGSNQSAAAVQGVSMSALSFADDIAEGKADASVMVNVGQNLHMVIMHHFISDLGVSKIAKLYNEFYEAGVIPLTLVVNSKGKQSVSFHALGKGMETETFNAMFGDAEAA